MDDPVILFVKPKAISNRDKKVLQGAGVIVIEIENVADVKLTRAHAELSGSDMLLAAMKTLNAANTYTKAAFAEAICATIEAQATR